MRTASELDALFTNLGARFDQYSGGVSKSVGDALQKALSEWQDFFYSGSWPDADLLRWSNAYDAASKALESSIASGAKQVQATGPKQAASKAMDVLTIGAGDPLNMPDLPVPKPWQFALLAVPMLYIFTLKRRK